MHKLESFALSCGSKINKPTVLKHFYPTPTNKYICISQDSESPAKSYDFFDDVIFHIKPFLEKQGIDIIQIGKLVQDPLFYCNHIFNLNQLNYNYIIDNSLLYFGNLNIHSNIAAFFNKPTVCVSQYDYIDLQKPYWSTDQNKILMSDKHIDKKPTFNPKESPKTINEIYPEVFAKSILDSLGIDNDLDKLETIFIGSEFNHRVVDIIPSQFDVKRVPLNTLVNLRMDKSFDLSFLLQCSSLTKINLVTNKVIPTNILQMLKNSLEQISFFIDKKTSIEELQQMESIGAPIKLLTHDTKNIESIRLKFIDYVVTQYGKLSKKDLKSKTYSDLRFLSKRNIIKNGQAFNSYLSVSENQNTSRVKNQKEFWEDLPFCRVYRKRS